MGDLLKEGKKKNADMSLELKLDHRKHNYSLVSQILSKHSCSLIENQKLINHYNNSQACEG